MVAATSSLTCYVSSPQLVDTGPLRNLLADLGVQAIAVDTLPTAGEALAPLLRDWLRQASFVLAVLPHGSSPNVYLEIGLALGLSRPLFLLVDGDGELPFALQRLPSLRASFDDVETIRFHLEAFIANLRQQGAKAAAAIAARPMRFYGGGEAIPVDRVPAPPSFSKAEREVGRLLGEVATQVTASARVGDRFEADFLAWLPDPEIGQGGPILIEVKASAMEPFPAKAEQQVLAALKSAHLRAGIIVSGHSGHALTGKLIGGVILYAISFNGLRDAIENATFLDDLRRTRNRLFHGVS